jgi:hypothetical protein
VKRPSRVAAILERVERDGIDTLTDDERRRLLAYVRGARTRARNALKTLATAERAFPRLQRDIALGHDMELAEANIERADKLEALLVGERGA